MERADGRRYESCPIWDLGEFYTEHWDTDSLCGMFRCRTCVAGPEDLGYCGPDGDGPSDRWAAGDWEIPF